MYRFTYELELFVARAHLHKGVGKSLMDRMIHLVDPGYSAKGQAPWITFEDDYIRDSVNRHVKVITAPIPHPQDSLPNEMVQFMQKFDFKAAGTIPEMGYKKGHM